jgi:hypothetical protein
VFHLATEESRFLGCIAISTKLQGIRSPKIVHMVLRDLILNWIVKKQDKGSGMAQTTVMNVD